MSTLETLKYIAIVIAGALLFAKLLGKIKFPDVTGYLLAGIVIGPMVLNIVPEDAVKNLEILSEVALAIIAFNIGTEMKISGLKRTGGAILTVTFMQAMATFVIVWFSLSYLMGMNHVYSLLIGSIACATAPAATLLVIKQYKAKGPIVETLIPVVAIDDAICIMAFGICASIAQSMVSGAGLSLHSALIEPAKEIIFSLILGLGSGIAGILLLRLVKHEGELTAFVVSFIFILTSLSLQFNLSTLLVMMSFGLALSNLSREGARAESSLDGLTPPLFMCFFTLSGADLNFAVFKTVGVVAIVYIIARAFGKISGAYIGARMTHMEKNIQNYLGFTLLPQAGVAIGLSLIATRIIGGTEGSEIRAIVLAATVVYELLGPIITKLALIRAGEIQLPTKKEHYL